MILALVERSQRLELRVLLSRFGIDERVGAALARLHVVELDVTDPDLRPRVLVERCATGNDEVGAEAVDAQRLAAVTSVVVDACFRHDHERVRVVVGDLFTYSNVENVRLEMCEQLTHLVATSSSSRPLVASLSQLTLLQRWTSKHQSVENQPQLRDSESQHDVILPQVGVVKVVRDPLSGFLSAVDAVDSLTKNSAVEKTFYVLSDTHEELIQSNSALPTLRW